MIGQLSQREAELRRALEEERRLNDGNAGRIKHAERKLQALLDSLGSMKTETSRRATDAA